MSERASVGALPEVPAVDCGYPFDASHQTVDVVREMASDAILNNLGHRTAP